MMKRIAFIFIAIIGLGFNSPQVKEVPFTVKEYQNLATFFDSKQDLLDFFEFHKGDVVADIGANNLKNEGAFSLITDSLTFYAEDIYKKLDQKKIKKVVKHYSKLRGAPINNKINFCNGDEKQTNLPEGAFDKMIITSVFHEFKYYDAMVDDIKKKLKPDGKVYVLKTECEKKGHYNFTCEEVTEIMQNHGFRPVKKQIPKARETWSVVYERV